MYGALFYRQDSVLKPVICSTYFNRRIQKCGQNLLLAAGDDTCKVVLNSIGSNGNLVCISGCIVHIDLSAICSQELQLNPIRPRKYSIQGVNFL